MVRRSPGPEPQTQGPPAQHDEPPQYQRGILEDDPRPLLRRTPLRPHHDLEGSRVVKVGKWVSGTEELTDLDTRSATQPCLPHETECAPPARQASNVVTSPVSRAIR